MSLVVVFGVNMMPDGYRYTGMIEVDLMRKSVGEADMEPEEGEVKVHIPWSQLPNFTKTASIMMLLVPVISYAIIVKIGIQRGAYLFTDFTASKIVPNIFAFLCFELCSFTFFATLIAFIWSKSKVIDIDFKVASDLSINEEPSQSWIVGFFVSGALTLIIALVMVN